MSKIIIVKHCIECRHSCMDREKGKQFCYEMREEGVKYCPDEGLPDWCPLPDLPERKDDGEIVFYGDGEPITETLANSLMDFGFNECLDAITEFEKDK